MDACFRFGECRRAKPPAVLAGDGDFAPAIFCAAKESHRKTQARWMAHRKIMARLLCAKAAHRKGASNVRCLPALHAQKSHTEKRRLDGWRTEKATARLLCAKAAHRKG